MSSQPVVVRDFGGWQLNYGGALPSELYPLDDLRPHVTDGGVCWCGAEENGDGTIVHRSADGREKFETGERKLS